MKPRDGASVTALARTDRAEEENGGETPPEEEA